MKRTSILYLATTVLVLGLLGACTPPGVTAPQSPGRPEGGGPLLQVGSTTTTARPATTAPPTTAPATTVTPVTTAPPATAPPTTTPPPPPPVGPPGALDASGRTVPSTNYPIPAGAVFMAPNGNDSNPGTQSAPVQSLRRAVSLTPSGGTLVLRGGDHRTWYPDGAGAGYEIVSKDLTIQAFPGEQPWLNGADVINDWTSSGAGRWSRAWSTPSFCEGAYYRLAPTAQSTNNTGPCAHRDQYGDPQYPMAGDPQMVFVNGIPLRQVASLAQVAVGTFHYDWSARRVTIGNNPAGQTVELAARPVALVLGGGKNYTVRGIGFRRFASNEYSSLTRGALYVGANRVIVEKTVFTQNAGHGLAMSGPANGSSVTQSVFVGNGANGLTANGDAGSPQRNDLLIEGNIFSGNNAERFGTNCSISCAASNVKLTRMNGFIARNNVFERAAGAAAGFWCDLDCRGGVIVNNLVRDNGKHGIYYEVSSGGIIASNLVTGNGEIGIAIASATTKVFNNTVTIDAARSPKAQGVWIYDDGRNPSSASSVGPNTSGVELVNNIVAGPAGVLVKAVNGTGGAGNSVTTQYFARFDTNAYQHRGQNIYNWLSPGVPPGSYFNNSRDFAAATGWERNAIDLNTATDPFFVNAAAGDFRVRSNSPAFRTGQALPADVATAMGVAAGTAVNRGALSWAPPPN